MPYSSIPSRKTGVFGYRLVELVYLYDVGAMVDLSPKERRQGALAITLIYGALILLALPMTAVAVQPAFQFLVNAMLVSIIMTTIMAIDAILLFPRAYWLHVILSVLTILVSFGFGMRLGVSVSDTSFVEEGWFLPGGAVFFILWLGSVLMVQIGLRYMNRVTQNISRDNARKNEELRLGNELQSKLLAPIQLEYSDIRIFAHGELASEVGGDFFDVWESGNTIRVVLGDVSGHGVAAGLMVSSLKAIISYGNKKGDALDEIFVEMNRFLRQYGHKGMFATCVALELNRTTQEMKLWNAGHPASIHIATDGNHNRLRPKGYALGMVSDFRIECQKLALSVGDRIIAFTDGFAEEKNKDRREFGDTLLLGIASKKEYSGQEVFNRLLESVHAHSGNETLADDGSLVVIDVVAQA